MKLTYSKMYVEYDTNTVDVLTDGRLWSAGSRKTAP